MPVRWNDDEVRKLVHKRVRANMREVGQLLRDKVVQKITRPQARRVSAGRATGLDPSKPGEPPKIVTGRLRAAQSWDVFDRGPLEVVARVGSTIEYQRWLELGTRKMRPRPHLRPALKENQRAIGKLFTGG